ncbi:hypothetical protein PYCCODRAFT_1469611 [Trametes coccinea BRFM310]|uniref:Uncharacterized protein n=1 Tax=Trametes coccinea (strain BRFM310) TaxID=1353009 RepID=A0A1Y2IJ53_TRAC3|nr:hypothetical protein PYCCODRAFT_1469611 [Trametes coccinea BRFM310]
MSYVQYTRDVQIKYKVTLEGWSLETLCKPADLPANVPLLQQIRDSLVSGQCFFRRLGASEYVAIKADYNARVASRQVKPRKKRSDAGKPRPRGRKHMFDTNDEQDTVSDGEDADGGGTDIAAGRAATKRPRLESGPVSTVVQVV